MFFLLGSAGSLVLSLAAVLYLNFHPPQGPGEPPPSAGPGATALCWLAVFFLPPLAMACWAGRFGTTLGLVTGLVATGVAWLAGYRAPVFIAAAFFAVAVLGGWLGHALGRFWKAAR